MFHSDRGSNYTSAEFAAVLKDLGIVHRTAYPTRKRAHDDAARYIEVRYNRQRLHSAPGYRTPQEVLDEYLDAQVAA